MTSGFMDGSAQKKFAIDCTRSKLSKPSAVVCKWSSLGPMSWEPKDADAHSSRHGRGQTTGEAFPW